MKPKKVTLLPGNLSGKTLAGPITDLVARAGAEVKWEWFTEEPSGENHSFSAESLESIRTNGVALRGPFHDFSEGIGLNPAVDLRKQLGLFAGVRQFRNLRRSLQDLQEVVMNRRVIINHKNATIT